MRYLLLFLVACGPAGAIPEPVEPTLVASTGVEGSAPVAETSDVHLPAISGLSPRLDMVYELVRFEQWIVAGTQGGVIVWDPDHGVPVAAHDEFICNSVVVSHGSVWAGCDKHVLEWNAEGWTEHLANDENDAAYYQLLQGPMGQLLVEYDGQNWEWNEAQRGFGPAQTSFGGYSAVYHNGQLFMINFMSGIRTPNGFVEIGSPTYPARDPRRLRVDERNRLWVEDFGAGLFRLDNGQFVQEPGLQNKGTGVAIDLSRDRLWMLHYTDGLTIKENGQVVRTIDLSDLQNMRDMLLDADGSVFVGGWTGIAHIRFEGGEVIRRDLRVPR